MAASRFLNTGRGRPENSQPETAALRNAGVLACELWHRPGALLKIEMLPITLREQLAIDMKGVPRPNLSAKGNLYDAMEGTTNPITFPCHSATRLACASFLAAALIFSPSSRAVDIPEAVIERAAQIPGADLSAVQLVDAASLPIGGSYWSVQRVHYPPAPCNWLATWTDDFQVYWLGAGTRYLVDDRGIDYEALGELQTAGLFTMYGSGGDDSGSGGTPLYATNDLWLELISASILSPTNLSAALVVHTPEIYGVYDLFFKRSLLPSNGWYWVARGLPGQTNFTLFHLPVDGGFFILGTTNFTDTNGLTAAYRGLIGGTGTLTNDFDNDGLPDAWEITFFGDLSQSPFADYDGDGVSNYGSYTNANFGDPNKIQFLLNFPAERVNSSAVFANLIIRAGNPAYSAVLVNNTNRAAANWQLFNSTNIPVNLNAGDGRYNVQIGLRGRAIGAQETWLGGQLILDTVPPVVAITNPASSSVVSWPLIQVQGWANEPLSRVSFDITNSTGLRTNLSGYITGQFADTNLLNFTTNYFQCYDVALAEGTNRITLRLTDLAGNTTTTNLTVRLDYSIEVTSPVLSILWPPNGTQIAGNSFTVRAQVDNPTATVKAAILDNGGNTNIVQGIVERNGLVWAKGLPLAPGSNTLILSATSAAGRTTSTSVSVVRSAVTVSLDPLSTNQLNKSSVNLTGQVSDSSAGVWVNGVQASVNAGEGWAATNVPASPNGTGIFDIEVYNSDSGPTNGVPIGSLQVDQPQPARVVLMSYSGRQHIDVSMSDHCLPLAGSKSAGDEVAWSYSDGGFSHYYGTEDWNQNPAFDITDNLSAEVGAISPPWEFTSVGLGIAGPHGVCEYDWIRWDNHTETRVMIEPEGQAPIGESRVYLVRARASQFVPPTVMDNLYGHNNLITGAFSSHAGTIPLSPDTLQINNVNLVNTGETNADGSTWGATLVSAPAGVRADVTPVATQVQGYKDYTSDAKAEEIKLSITANGITLDPNKVVTNANFIVGQVLTFSTNWSKVLPGVASRSVQWTFEGHFLNESNQLCADCSPNYTTNQAKLTNEVTAAWWVSGANPAATYSAQLTETLTLSNGSNVVVSGKGLFSMLRPLPIFSAPIRETVRVDTNYWFGSLPPSADRTWLHFGINSTLSDVGIAFVYTNAPTDPATSETYGHYFITQVIDYLQQRYNLIVTNTCKGYETNDTHALDFGNPYQGRASDRTFSEWNDAPSALLTTARWLSHTNSFTTHLMFQAKPYTNSIPVPLYKVQWSWSGSATNNPWGERFGSASTNNLSLTDDFPTWTHIRGPIDSSPQYMFETGCFDEN